MRDQVSFQRAHLGLLEVQVLSVLDGEVDVLQDDVDSLLVCAVEGQEPHHAVVIDLDTTAVTDNHLTPPRRPLTSSHQTTDGFCQLLELCAPDGSRVIFHHGVHVRVQIPEDIRTVRTTGRRLDLNTRNSLFNLLLGSRAQQVHFGHDVDLRDL